MEYTFTNNVTVYVTATPYEEYCVTVMQDGVVQGVEFMANEPTVAYSRDRKTGDNVVTLSASYGEVVPVWF